jgi:hypothetical protein
MCRCSLAEEPFPAPEKNSATPSPVTAHRSASVPDRARENRTDLSEKDEKAMSSTPETVTLGKGARRTRGRRRARRRLPVAAAALAGILSATAGGTAFAMGGGVVLDTDGRERTVHTFGGTVQDVLDSAGVTLEEDDAVAPAPDEPAVPDMVVEILPVLGEPVTEEVVIEAGTVEEDAPDLPEGERRVVVEPEDGLREVTTATVLRDGEEVEHPLREEIVTEPVEGLVRVGTGADGDDAPPSGAAGLNWQALARCESGGDPGAVNSAGGYHGLYQFSTTTWASVGGSGLPSDASPAEQTRRAQHLYDSVGGDWRSQWPHCGVHLFD